MIDCDVAIVGGGASGLALAVYLAEKKLKIVIIEGLPRAGKKLAATGNGQGNISNADMSADKYFGGGAPLAWDIIDRYKDKWKSLFLGKFITDERGRIYPAGRQASALSDCLLKRLEKEGITLLTGDRVADIADLTEIDGSKKFILKLNGGQKVKAKYCALCAGGKAQKQFGTDGSAYALAQKYGHEITPLYPSLVQLKTDTAYIKTLRGIRADCIVTAIVNNKEVARERGDVIFTEYGVSGNAIFAVSAHIADKQGAILNLEFAPDFTMEEIERDVVRKKSFGYADSELLACTLNNQIGRAIIKRCNSSNEKQIAYMVKNFTLPVTGTLGFDYAQVTKGGISFGGVKSNLESKYRDNLFFAGEILDVDGACGGYNLTWAFSSAAAVAEEIAKRYD